MTPEARVKHKGRELFKKYGCYYAPIITGGMGVTGTPDALICWKGLFIGCEYKATAKNKLTETQALRLEQIVNAGGVALLVSAETLNVLSDWLDEMSSQTSGPCIEYIRTALDTRYPELLPTIGDRRLNGSK